MKKNNIKGSIILLLAAFIWGLAFVAQNKMSDSIPPFMVNCLRSFISMAFLYVFWRFINRKKFMPVFPSDKKERSEVIKGSAVCGLMLAIASNFQQFGISFYPKDAAVEAHAGFITALYVIIVPIISVLLKKKIPIMVWLAAITAVTGFYFLCLWGGVGRLYIGDILVLACAVSFSLHILSVDRFVGAVGGVRLSMLQCFVCGVISAILAFCFERDSITLSGIVACALPILYLGIMSSGVAYTLQIVGQRYAEPAVASLVMSLESVFAALGGWVISGNTLHANEIFGCVLVFSAIIIAQLPELLQRN